MRRPLPIFNEAPSTLHTSTVQVLIGNPDLGKWCNSEVYLRSTSATASEGDWRRFVIPMSSFNCDAAQDTASQIGFQPLEQVNFCIDYLKLDR